MREIKPSVLSKIMNHIYDGETKSHLMDSLKGILSNLFRRSEFNFLVCKY